MIKAPLSLQDLRRRLYVKAKVEPAGYMSAEISVYIDRMSCKLRRIHIRANATVA